MMKTLEAATRFNPTPPAFMLTRNTDPLSLTSPSLLGLFFDFADEFLLNLPIIDTRSFKDMEPSMRKHVTPILSRAPPTMSRKPRYCEKIRTFDLGSNLQTFSSSAKTASSFELLAPFNADSSVSLATTSRWVTSGAALTFGEFSFSV